MIYQYIGIIVGFVAIILTIRRFREGRMSQGMTLLWMIVWIILIAVSIDPNLTSLFAQITGIGRGLDLILILGLIGAYYLIFKIYNMLENIEEQMTELVREVALERSQSRPEIKTED